MKDTAILIIDDSETDRYLLKRSIEKTKKISFVYEEENGQSALDFLRKIYTTPIEEFCLPIMIFLDVNMPLLDGFDFLEKYVNLLKENPNMESSQVIMFSSSENESDRKKALDYDFVSDYLVKGKAGPKIIQEKIINMLADFNS